MSVISEARQEQINKLPVVVLYDALSDRKLDDYTELVEKVKYESEISELTFAEIEALLKEHKLPGGKEIEEEKAESAFVKYDDMETSAPAVDVEGIDVKETTKEAGFKEEEPEDEYEEEVAVEEEEEEKPKTNVASDLADYVAKQISSDSPLEDLNALIVGRTRRKIVKKLFKRNEQDFVTFLDALNKESSWKIASKIIDDEFYEREVNPYSKEAISLSDIIYLRFFPKDKYVGESDTSRFD